MSSETEKGILTWKSTENQSSILLHEGNYIIGSKCRMVDIHVKSSKISRHHVTLSLEAGRVFVKDMGSKNPVKLRPQGKVIPKETLFEINPATQYFRIGDVDFKITLYPQSRQSEISTKSMEFSEIQTKSMKRIEGEKIERRESSSEETISIKKSQSIASLDQNRGD